MDARTAFWNFYAEMLYIDFYLIEYKLNVSRRENFLTWFVALASSAFVATLAFWDRYPILWFLITIAVQIVGIVRPSFNYSKIEYSINLALPEIQTVIDEMERMWIAIDKKPEETVVELRLKYKEKYNSIDNRFLLALNLRSDKKIAEKAMTSRDNYIHTNFTSSNQEVSV